MYICISSTFDTIEFHYSFAHKPLILLDDFHIKKLDGFLCTPAENGDSWIPDFILPAENFSSIFPLFFDF